MKKREVERLPFFIVLTELVLYTMPFLPCPDFPRLPFLPRDT